MSLVQYRANVGNYLYDVENIKVKRNCSGVYQGKKKLFGRPCYFFHFDIKRLI